MENLDKAKAQLIQRQPFFATLFLGMELIEDRSCKTLKTNGEWIKYNPQFLIDKSVDEIMFALAHEVMHGALQHMTRRGDRNPNRWNMAADYIINDTLVKEGVGKLIDGCLLDANLVAQSDGSAEGVYDLLPEETEQQDGSGGQGHGQGGAMDEVEDAAQDQAGQAQAEANMRVRLVQAANVAKMAGKLSAGMKRMVEQMTKSRVDWRSVLRNYFTDRAKTKYSFAKPKRRFLGEDFILPGLTGEKMGEVVFVVDTSMSITDRVLERFATECRAICEDVEPSKIHVIYCDAEVQLNKDGSHDEFEDPTQFKMDSKGGGGTAFQPAFDYIAEKGINPVALVYLTDLESSDVPEDPGYPVLWATIKPGKMPFGEVLEIQE